MTFVIFSFFHYTICAICGRIKLTGHENVPCGNYEKGGKHRMQKAIDKHVILMMGLLFLLNRSLTYGPVVTFLAALISMELIIYLEKEAVFYGIVAVYVLACFFAPGLIFFLPVHIYEFVYRKKWWGCLSCALFVYRISLFHGAGQILLWIMTVMLAVLLAVRTRQQVQEHAAFLKLRDSSVEEQAKMKQRNKELLEKQDYEIRVATLSERNRIAREIHDNVGHMLSRCILQLGALMMVHKKEETLYAQLSSVNASLNEAMNNIRESVHDLHDESVDLKQAVVEATSQMRQNYELQLVYDMSPQVPRNVKYAMIAIVKEAMANIIKHSNATKVSVMLWEHPGFYQLLIEDNGTQIRENKHAGIGLTNMRQRVEALGGNIHFRTDAGFAIIVSIRKEMKECG